MEDNRINKLRTIRTLDCKLNIFWRTTEKLNERMIKRNLIIICLLTVSGIGQHLFSQQKGFIKLIIKDASTLQSLPNASVIYNEGEHAWVANEQGEVLIPSKYQDGPLFISYVGYTGKTLGPSKTRSEMIEARLERTSISLNNNITVTTQRKKQQDKFVPYTIQTLHNKDLMTYSPRTIPESLMGMTGVFVQKTNHGGGSPFIRGLTGNQTLILYDGIRLNNSIYRYGPNQYLNTIDPYSVDRIEVAKGTGSVQYGSDAIGGVVQVFSNELSFSDKHSWNGSRVLAKYMSADMEKTIRGQLNYSSRRMAVQGGVTYRKFGDIIGGDTTGRQRPSGYDEKAFDLKLKYNITDRSVITLANQFVQQTGVPVYHKVQLENFLYNNTDLQQRMLQYARYELTSNVPLFSRLEVTVSHQQNLEERSSLKRNAAISKFESDRVKGTGFTAEVFSKYNKWWTSQTGIEWYHDRVSSSAMDKSTTTNDQVVKRGLYPDDSKLDNYSIHTLHHLSFEKWIIDAGLRYNRVSIDITDTSLGSVNISPSAVVGNVGLLYKLSRMHSVYGSISTGFRAPNIDDMGTLGIVDFRYEVPSSSLAPERSLHGEFGYRFHSSKLAISANLFFLKLKDIITREKKGDETINGYPVYEKNNSEHAHLKGAELELQYSITNAFKMEGSIAYTYGQNDSRKEPLRRVPPMHGRMSARYTVNKLFMSVEAQYATSQSRLAKGDTEDNRIPMGGTPGWNIYNVYTGYTHKNLSINAGLQNLFDIDYRTHGSGINGYGRSAWFQVGWIF